MGDVREYQFVTGIETSSIPDPGTPSASTSTISKGYADTTYARRASWYESQQTVANVKSIASADRADNQVIWVDDLGAFFKFDSASTATGNDTTVITPTSGTGRWLIATASPTGGISTDIMTDGFQNFVIESELTPATTAPGASEFLTYGILKRANVKNLKSDLKSRIGVERIKVNKLATLFSEIGPSSLIVRKSVEDVKDQMRFCGTWTETISSKGQFVSSSTASDFIEVVFYGTGLAILLEFSTDTGADFRAKVDENAEGANFVPGTGSIAALDNQFYFPNIIVPVVTGLTQGLHSVKIRIVSGTMRCGGFDIFNTTSTVKTNPGNAYISGTKVPLAAQDSAAINSSFAEILRDGSVVGSLGARGARVLTYLKSDGTIAKAAVETNAAAAYVSSANHTYEVLRRTYHFREFGANRGDDFADITSASVNRAYTLDDATTCLIGANATTDANNNYLGLTLTTGSWTFTFVGTGIDIVAQGNATGTTDNFSIDGTSIGTISVTSGVDQRFTIASGLAYGTHVLSFTRASSTYPLVREFHVYEQKKPTLPTNCIEIGEYFIPATFVANSTVGVNRISTGVIRRNIASKEAIYINGTGGTQDWTAAQSVGNYVSAFVNQTDRSAAYVEFTFLGTGFDLRFRTISTNSANITVQLNGTLVTATNFPTATFTTYGTGVAFNSGTGILDQADASDQPGCGFTLSGLTYGVYTLRLTNNTASSFLKSECIDVITPTYYPTDRSPLAVNNTAAIGANSIGDLRALTPLRKADKTRNVLLYARGVTGSPTTSVTTSILMPQMSGVIDHDGGWLMLYFNGEFTHDTGSGTAAVRFNVDGVLIGPDWIQTCPGTGVIFMVSFQAPLYLAAGKHFIQAMWRTNSGILTNQSSGRELVVTKLDWSTL